MTPGLVSVTLRLLAGGLTQALVDFCGSLELNAVVLSLCNAPSNLPPTCCQAKVSPSLQNPVKKTENRHRSLEQQASSPLARLLLGSCLR